MLRSLDEQLNLLLIITEPHLMRSFYYRAGCGMELLLCHTFEHMRASAQALSKVAKYSDYARRFKLPGMEFIDPDLKERYIGGLHENNKESKKHSILISKVNEVQTNQQILKRE